jgi:putative DNA primase/helicase
MKAVKVRDWLGELHGAGRAEDLDKFQGIVAEMAKAGPDLEGEACRIAGEYFEGGEIWSADLYSMEVREKAEARWEAAERAKVTPLFCAPIPPKREGEVDCTQVEVPPVAVVKLVRRENEVQLKIEAEPEPAVPEPAKAEAEEAGLAGLVEELREKAEARAKPDEDGPKGDAGGGEEAYVEDGENRAEDIRRRLWRVKEALGWVKFEGMEEKVGGVLWRLSEGNMEIGCSVWIEWLKKNGCDEEEGRRRWRAGFDDVGRVDELYGIAQRRGWRFPVAQNLNRLEEMAGRVEGALVRVGADVYQVAGGLVRPVTVEVDASKGRKTRIARLVKIEGAFLKAELSRYVDFFSWKKEGGERSPIGPPVDVVSAVLSRYGRWEFPRVAGIICAPTLRRDGSVLAKEGWDLATELLVMGPLPEMPTLADRPTRKEAERAVKLLDEGLLGAFPFVDGASRSAAMSGLISPVVRAALGCVPMHASTAPAAGTGKSFLWDLAAGIAIGDAMPVIATGADLVEMGKRLDAQVIAGMSLLSIDNVTRPIGGDELCQLIERPSYIPRVLGKSEMKERRNCWGIYATGNNLRLKDDVTRRTLLVRLDAGVERPELRVFKRNPLAEVLRDRGLYLWAVLTVVRAYMAAGMPGRLNPIGDPFAEWSDLVRSALVWLGYEDCVATMEAVRENDPSRQARVAMFQAMVNAYGAGPEGRRQASQMVTDAKNGGFSKPGTSLLDAKRSVEAVNLKAAIIGYTDNRLDGKYLGNKLYTDLNAIADGLCLRRLYDSHTKVNHWYVEAPGAGQ